jgi:transposase
VDALHAWLTVQLGQVSGRSNLAEAIRYALRHWPGLALFLEDGRLELDTNTVERAIRPIALGRKNPLRGLGRRRPPLGDRGQPGGDREAERGRAAGVAHRRARVDVAGRTKATELTRLLPWAWKAEQLAATADA